MKKYVIWESSLILVITTLFIFQNCSPMKPDPLTEGPNYIDHTLPGDVTPPTVGCPDTITAPDPYAPGGVATRTFRKIYDITSYWIVPSINNPQFSHRKNVDFSEYINVWGYAQTKTPLPDPKPWPGVRGVSWPMFKMPRNAYFGAHFKTPKKEDVPPESSAKFGFYSTLSYATVAANVTVSISKKCGDFAATPHIDGGQPVRGGNPCYARNRANDDGAIINWGMSDVVPEPSRKSYCTLDYDTDYYFNVMPSSTQINDNDRCKDTTCLIMIGTR